MNGSFSKGPFKDRSHLDFLNCGLVRSLASRYTMILACFEVLLFQCKILLREFGTSRIECMCVTSFSSISYYSNLRSISKIDLVRNFQSVVNQKSYVSPQNISPPPPFTSTQSHITPFPGNRPIMSPVSLVFQYNLSWLCGPA